MPHRLVDPGNRMSSVVTGIVNNRALQMKR